MSEENRGGTALDRRCTVCGGSLGSVSAWLGGQPYHHACVPRNVKKCPVCGGTDHAYCDRGLNARNAELEAENTRLRDLIRRCMKVGCQWCGLPAVSFEVEQRVTRQAGAERSTQ